MSAQANFERLIVMSERLAAALEADIEALERGQVRELRAIAPEIQQLSANFTREASAVTQTTANSVPAELRERLGKATGRFRKALAMHARLVTRMRNASEGLIRTVAEEIERQRSTLRTYAPAAPRHAAPTAMLYNNLI